MDRDSVVVTTVHVVVDNSLVKTALNHDRSVERCPIFLGDVSVAIQVTVSENDVVLLVQAFHGTQFVLNSLTTLIISLINGAEKVDRDGNIDMVTLVVMMCWDGGT